MDIQWNLYSLVFKDFLSLTIFSLIILITILMKLNHKSGYAITISDLYSRKELLTINSVEIQQVFGGNTPTDTFKTLNYKKLSPIGQAL